MDSNQKNILGSALLVAGSLASMSAVGGLITLYFNSVRYSDSMLKLAGFSPAVTVLVLGLAAVLIYGGVRLVKRPPVTLGVSLIALGLCLGFVATILPFDAKSEILTTFSMQRLPSAIALLAVAAGTVFLLIGLQKRPREKSA